MLLAASSIESAKAPIDRGVAADQQLGKRGVPEVQAVLINTQDAARNVRAVRYPPSGRVPVLGLHIENTSEPLAAPFGR